MKYLNLLNVRRMTLALLQSLLLLGLLMSAPKLCADAHVGPFWDHGDGDDVPEVSGVHLYLRTTSGYCYSQILKALVKVMVAMKS